MAKSLDDLLDALPGPVASLDHIEGGVRMRISARTSRARLKVVISVNLSVALAALTVGTAIGVLQSVRPPRLETHVNLVLTDIPSGALVD
jgi:hypothetical protein